MSKEEIRKEINKVLDQFSDKVLSDLLSFIRGILEKHPITLSSEENFSKVLAEDKDLLQRLANRESND